MLTFKEIIFGTSIMMEILGMDQQQFFFRAEMHCKFIVIEKKIKVVVGQTKPYKLI